MQKIAIFGGTFNPVHCGHLLIAETALNQAVLNCVIWVPTYLPPHKLKTETSLSYRHRFEMVKLATATHTHFRVSAIESEYSGVSYAVDTLKRLQKQYVDAEWYWIIGLDAFQSLPRWYGRQELVKTCRWLVAPRPAPALVNAESSTNQSRLAMAEQACTQVAQQLADQSMTVQWQVLKMPLVDISSSLIREYCCKKVSIRYFVPEAVRAYIAAHDLYTCP